MGRRLRAVSLVAVLLACSVLVMGQSRVTPSRVYQAFQQLTDYLLIGTGLNTDSIRLDVSSGVFRVREGDNLADGPMSALSYSSGNGSAAAPAFTFTSETGTGFYRPFASGFTITIAGVPTAMFSGDPAGRGALQLGADKPIGWASTNNPVSATSDVFVKRAAAGAVRIATASDANTYDITLADWGTALSAEGVPVANSGLLYLGASKIGRLVITGSGNELGQFQLNGTGNSTSASTDNNSTTSATKDTASRINVYYDAAGASGAGYYIQNLRGGTVTIRALLIGA
jgi:hypothetical protein